jgi:hypothetical protein
MRRVPAILAVLLLITLSAQAQLGLEQAAIAYQTGDYAAAIALWETAHQNGVRDGALYYNLGTAYYASGDLAHALVNMLRAAAYLPRDPDVQMLLGRMRAERLDPFADEADSMVLLGTFTNTTASLAELATFAFALYVVFWGCVVAHMLRPTWRVYMQWLIGCLALLVVVSLILLGSRITLEQQRPVAVIAAPTTQAMSGPGLDYLPLFSLMAAAEVRILETRVGWVRIVLSDGRQGWLPVETIEKVWGS